VPVGASSVHHCRQRLRTIPALVPVAAQEAFRCVAMGDESDITAAICGDGPEVILPSRRRASQMPKDIAVIERALTER
jgi:hypothetical protein